MDAKTEIFTATAEPRSVSRTALNFWIDLATAVLFALLLGSSFIMKWILPPGTCDDAGVKVWLGHSRHWWGDIHFWAAMLLIALIVVHTWLHWGWVLCTWRKFVGSMRSPATWGVLAVLAGLLVVPFAVPAYYLEVPETATSLAAGGAAPEKATVAPCGIEGLSCADCPAAGDRLFGPGCGGSEDDAVAEGSEAVDDGDAVDDGAATEDGKSAEDDAADTSAEDSAGNDCATCPFSGDCGDEGSCADETEPDDTAKEV